jgi:hypothetical protein
MPSSRLLEALAQHYGKAEFTARGAAELFAGSWAAVGVPDPDPESCGRWLRSRRKRGAVAGLYLAACPDRSGVNRWRLRCVASRVPPDAMPCRGGAVVTTSAPAGDAEQRLLEALSERYGSGEFSARVAATDIPGILWQAAGVARPDASSCGRWLRSHRSATLVGKPDRTGVVRWRLRGAAAPVAARQAPGSATSVPAPPTAQQAPQPVPEPPPPPQRSWWHMSATAPDSGLPGPRWGCGTWWMPEPETAP